MKNRKVLGLRKNGSAYLRNNNEVSAYVAGSRHYLVKQITSAGFDVIKSPQIVKVWCHFYSKYENGLPTFDIDGAVTTIVEMLQPRSVSGLGLHCPVYDNDRQVRGGQQTEEEVASRKFEKAVIAIWVPSGRGLFYDLHGVDATGWTSSQEADTEYEDILDLIG